MSSALVVPCANQEVFTRHLQEISLLVPAERHAVIVTDRAGWHQTKNIKVPNNLSILHLPPYSPELNPQEQVWQYLKDKYLANRVFENIDDILQACCDAWNQFITKPGLIRSIGLREWAVIPIARNK